MLAELVIGGNLVASVYAFSVNWCLSIISFSISAVGQYVAALSFFQHPYTVIIFKDNTVGFYSIVRSIRIPVMNIYKMVMGRNIFVVYFGGGKKIIYTYMVDHEFLKFAIDILAINGKVIIEGKYLIKALQSYNRDRK